MRRWRGGASMCSRPSSAFHSARASRRTWSKPSDCAVARLPRAPGTSTVVSALDEAARNWGVKVLRYEIKDLTPPQEILRSMQAQITAEREKRALIAASEGRRQEQINIATGEREAFIARSEGEKQAEINKAQGEAAAITAVAEATADAIRKIASAIQAPGGEQAVQLKVAEKAVDAYAQLAQKNNTMIVPGNMTEVAGLIATHFAEGGAPERAAAYALRAGRRAATAWQPPRWPIRASRSTRICTRARCST